MIRSDEASKSGKEALMISWTLNTESQQQHTHTRSHTHKFFVSGRAWSQPQAAWHSHSEPFTQRFCCEKGWWAAHPSSVLLGVLMALGSLSPVSDDKAWQRLSLRPEEAGKNKGDRWHYISTRAGPALPSQGSRRAALGLLLRRAVWEAGLYSTGGEGEEWRETAHVRQGQQDTHKDSLRGCACLSLIKLMTEEEWGR